MRWTCWMLCLWVVSSRAAAGAEPDLPTPPALADLIAQSLAARPELTQAMAEARAAVERIGQSTAWADPVVQLGIQNDGFTSWELGKMEGSFVSIMASQTFPWPGKTRLRGEVARANAEQGQQVVDRVKLSTEAEVRRAYLNLALARDRLALLDRLDTIWQKSASIARTRYETGQGAQSDVLRAQLELNRIRQRRRAMQADAQNNVQTLNRLRAHPLDDAVETPGALVELPLPAPREVGEIVADALARSPELAASRLGVTQAESAVALAHRNYWPDVTVNAGVMVRGGTFPPMWQASVAVPLPVFAGSKQARAVNEAEAGIVARQQGVARVEQLLRLRAQQRATALAAVLETVRLYREGLLVQSEATANSTLSQYAVDKVTFASVLDANAGFIADQEGYLLAVAQAHQLEIDRWELSLDGFSSSAGSMGAASVPGSGTTRRGVAGSSKFTLPSASNESSASMPNM